jgi:hypothetical protein
MELAARLKPNHRSVPPSWVGDPTVLLAVSSALWFSRDDDGIEDKATNPDFDEFRFPPE